MFEHWNNWKNVQTPDHHWKNWKKMPVIGDHVAHQPVIIIGNQNP
jgi:hypothetical protein